MNWDKLLSSDRLQGGKKNDSYQDSRTPFESDIDRIVFANSFRRLSRKTQVHPFCKNDHVHTRLTHSLEVAQVGRSLGKALGDKIHDQLPQGVSSSDVGAIVQAACLVHDLGNPPFGHAGEAAISHWFASNGGRFLDGFTGPHRHDIACFEGNAQGFRILTQTENHLFHGGLRLTYATLGAFMKYPWSSRTVIDGQKFGAFISEEHILEMVAKGTGLIKKNSYKWCRHPLAFLSEAADHLCYATIDIEDAVELGVLQPAEAYTVLLSAFDEQAQARVKRRMLDEKAYRVNFARIRGPIYDALVSAVVEAFMGAYDQIMQGTLETDLLSLLKENDQRRMMIEKAIKIGEKNIYTERFKTEIELGCFSTFECLLDAFCTAAVECAQHLHSPSDETTLTWKSKLVLRQLGNHAPQKDNAPPDRRWSKYLCLRRVLDYVSGMTDNYAQDLAEHLRGIAGQR